MTISTKRQLRSNMLWRFFVFLLLGGFIAICFCEPVNRKRLLQGANESANNDISRYKTNNTVNNTLLPNSENQTRSSRKVPQKLFDDVNDVSEVTARKKNKKGKGGNMMIYLIFALKAALIYGLINMLAVFAGKAILIAKVAIALAIASFLKKNDHGKTYYEIVRHPHTSYIQTHSSSIDYDHRSDYNDDRNDYVYEHRKRRQLIF